MKAGYGHTCAIVAPSQGTVALGGLKCWGRNWEGELGDGTTTDRFSPVDVRGLTNGVSDVAVGGEHICALVGPLTGTLVMGGVKCWGQGGKGQIGDGTTIGRSVPTDVWRWTQDVTAIIAGRWHTCIVTQRGGVKCWGNNVEGELGRDIMTSSLTPVDVVAAVELDNILGVPSSTFVLIGEGLPPNRPATMAINGRALTTTVPVNEAGRFIAFINTTGADAGDIISR